MKRTITTCCLALGLGLLAPSEASAFCGFYVAGADAELFNDATIVVLMRDGTRTVLSMQNSYQGPPEDFALVIPVPVVLQEGDVKTLRRGLFDRVETLSSPRLVEYWEEDPCKPRDDKLGEGKMGKPSGGVAPGYGADAPRSTVIVEAQFTVAEYEIVILSATESSGLEQWLRDNDYAIPDGAEPLLRPYVQQGMRFFVAKVDPKKVQFGGNGRVMLSPLRFHYDSPDFVLPVRLGLINAPDPATGGKQDLLIHILSPTTRYEVANRPNVTIPTNLDLNESARDRFGEFYVALFDQTLEQNPGAVVTEYAWAAGKCDPCPTYHAALTNQELLELGADVLFVPPGPPPEPTIERREPFPLSDLDEDAVHRAVWPHVDEIRACYDRGLSSNPRLSGDLTLYFRVAATGKVDGVKALASTLGEAEVERCIERAAKQWRFPKPPDGESAKIAYPLTFSSGWETPTSERLSNFVLTRLHARHDATTLGEDLVFQAAPPIVGGRETRNSWRGVEKGATVVEDGVNNFQARYAIRHAWTGAMACEDPIRGRWGDPPRGWSPAPKAAKQLAETTRGASPSSFLAKDSSLAARAADEGTRSSSKRGCACSADARPTFAGPLALLALLGLARRQRR